MDEHSSSPLGAPPPQNLECVHLPSTVLPNELARHAIGLANARGGTIYIGAESHDPGVSDELHPLMLTHAIFELSDGRLQVQVYTHRRISGGKAMSVKVARGHYVLATQNGEVITWNGEALVPLPGDRSAPLPDVDPTATVLPTATLGDIDPYAVVRLRELLERSGGDASGLARLPDVDFMQSLGLMVVQGGTIRPNLAGILLAGTKTALRRYAPQSEVCFFYHTQDDIEFSYREDILRPIPDLLARLVDHIQARNSLTPVQVGLFRIEVWDQHQDVYREALLNAITHRNYLLNDVVHVHLYPSRLDIMNPGSFAGGITPSNILRHQPKRRNPLLAQVLAKLGLIEQAGVGVDKMFSLMLRHGKEPPEYTTYSDAVQITLHSLGFNAEFVSFVAQKQEEKLTISLDMLIVLSVLAREGESTRQTLAHALQLPEERTPRLLRQMEEMGFVARVGTGRNLQYVLSDEVQRKLRRPMRRAVAQRPSSASSEPIWAKNSFSLRPTAPTPSSAPIVQDRPLKTSQAPHFVALELAQQGDLSAADLARASGLSSSQARRLLEKMAKHGTLERLQRGRRVFYRAPAAEEGVLT